MSWTSSKIFDYELNAIDLSFRSSNAVRKKYKVSFAPTFPGGSLYQDLLAKHLEHIGIHVDGIDRRQRFLPVPAIYNKSNIVHLHWLHSFFSPPFSVKSNIFRYLVSPLALLRLTFFIAGLGILKFVGVKIVWTAHNLKYHEQIYPLLDRICTASVVFLSDAIIAHCDAAKCEISRKFNLINDKKIYVIPHGNFISNYSDEINRDEARKVINVPQDSFVFLFFGFIRPYKGVFELIEAFQRLPGNNLYLVIVGKTLNEEISEQILKKIENYTNIKFLPGFVPDDKVQVYMNSSDIVVLPYRDVLTSGAGVLAMSFAKACAAVRIGCIGDILDDKGAFLYELNDQNGLQKAMYAASQNRDVLESMGKHNRQKVAQWSWEFVAEKTQEVYEYCLES